MMSEFRLGEIACKDVITVSGGENLGRVCDAELDAVSGQVLRLILPGKPKYFGLFGRGEDTIVLWRDIVLIGKDVILVRGAEKELKAVQT